MQSSDQHGDASKGPAGSRFVPQAQPDRLPTPVGGIDNCFDSENRWDEPANSSDTPNRTGGSALAENPDATPLPRTGARVEDVWGSDFHGATPGTTLKQPRKSRLAALKTLMAAQPAVPKNLAVEGYELLNVLGEGGVGIVYQAIQKSIDRRIAVKMIRPEIAADAREREKFITEAMVTGELDHPNIVPIHDLGKTRQGHPFYVMKMVKGTPWHEVINEKPLSENLRILLDICDAVSFAHSKGVIHRDLKPENVMLGEFGEVQLMDWGLGASILKDGKVVSLSASLAAGGTPAYMAPEMVTGQDGPVGIHSDVYLLGAILYEIITGKTPHGGERVLDCLQNARDNVIQPTDKTSVLVDIALKAMRTRPVERYPSAKAFKEELLDYRAHEESINLHQQAFLDLHAARNDQDYERFAQALFGFREALKLWAANAEAQAGVAETQLHYARCAFQKGDFDLAASLLDPNCAAHKQLGNDVRAAQQKRMVAQRRLKAFRVTALSLTALVILVLTVASIWIAAARRQALVAKDAAVAAHHAELRQRRLAEAAMVKAQQEENRAVAALTKLEQAVKAMLEARTKKEQAVAKAKAYEQVAAKTRDELARAGMLLDNSWWVFDAETARQRQGEATESTGLPAELRLSLANDALLDLVLIPPGEFVMGSPPREQMRAADEYLHRVVLSRPLYLGKFEVTAGQWQAVTGMLPEALREHITDPRQPIRGVTVEQITTELLPGLQAYAPQGCEFRLPTEAEWEYACRGGAPTAYHAGDGLDALIRAGWFLSNSGRKVQAVGQKLPNAFGLYDMHGNVGEICADKYVADFYLESDANAPFCTLPGDRFVVRGGSVLNMPEHCRAAYRSYVYFKNRYEFLGVRLAMVPQSEASATEGVDQQANRPDER